MLQLNKDTASACANVAMYIPWSINMIHAKRSLELSPGYLSSYRRQCFSFRLTLNDLGILNEFERNGQFDDIDNWVWNEKILTQIVGAGSGSGVEIVDQSDPVYTKGREDVRDGLAAYEKDIRQGIVKSMRERYQSVLSAAGYVDRDLLTLFAAGRNMKPSCLLGVGEIISATVEGSLQKRLETAISSHYFRPVDDLILKDHFSAPQSLTQDCFVLDSNLGMAEDLLSIVSDWSTGSSTYCSQH